MKKIFFFLAFITIVFACNKKQNASISVKDLNKKKQDTIVSIKDHNYDIATSFLDKNNDSAFYYFNKMATTSKDSLYVALAYNLMARIQYDVGDYFGHQESLTLSLKYLNEKKEQDSSIIASDYNGLGLNNLYFKNYEPALNYYNLSLKFNKNDAVELMTLNNKALVYQETGNYNRAIQIYNEIIPRYKDDPEQYVRAVSNLAKTKWLQNPNYNALPEFLNALHIREKENDLRGQNASYAHLADYYAQKQPDSALFYAGKMYLIAKKIKSPDDQIEALQKLIVLSPAQKIKQYFEIYQKLADSLQTTRNAAKNQFALIRYEVEKNKSDNLILQKDNSEKKYQIITQRFIIAGTLLFVIAAAIISGLWYKKRKQRLELEAENVVRENELRTSKKVHDGIANGLYQLATEVENQDNPNMTRLVNKLWELYDKSRDISYENEGQFIDLNFQKKLTGLLTSFKTENTKITISGNTRKLWEGVSVSTRNEVMLMLRELMVNMSKHSNANKASIRFTSENNNITIYYADNGIGISEETKFKNGLTNTGNRIKSINGAITFDKTGDGLKIRFSFPAS